MVEVRNDAESKALYDFLVTTESFDDVWIGLRDTPEEPNVLKWQNSGEEVRYENWYNEPNFNEPGNNCAKVRVLKTPQPIISAFFSFRKYQHFERSFDFIFENLAHLVTIFCIIKIHNCFAPKFFAYLS